MWHTEGKNTMEMVIIRGTCDTENGGRAFKNKLPTLSKKDKANGKKIKQVV